MSAADEIAEFYVHTAAVETFLGRGARGPQYAPPADVACFASIQRHLVRAASGEQVVSESRLTAPVAAYDTLKPDSRVTVNGRTSFVITAKLATSGALDLPDHCTAALT